MVPADVVDHIIAEDFSSHGDGTYTVYVLNPPAHAPYAYSYGDGRCAVGCWMLEWA